MKKNILIICLSAIMALNLFSSCKSTAKIENNDYISQQTSSYFASNDGANGENLALSDASNIGINKKIFDENITYPLKQSYDVVIDAQEKGVVPSDESDDTLALMRCISEAKKADANSSKVINLPKGDIYITEGFNSVDYRYGLSIDGISNLTINGNGCVIYFYGTFSGFKGMHVTNCVNFMLYDIQFDWGVLPYVMASVVSCDTVNSSVTVKANSGYILDGSVDVIEYLEFDKKTNLPRENGNFSYIHNANIGITSVEYLKDNTAKIHFRDNITNAPIGTKVVLAKTMTMSETIIIEKSKNVVFEHVYLYASPGMAIKAYSCENLYFNHFRAICKPNTDRLMTATADILHLKNTLGEIVITNSQFENSHDDAINIGGHFLRIKDILSNGQVRIISQLGMSETFMPNVDDKYEITDTDTLEVLKVVTIKSVALCSDGYLVTFREGNSGLSIDQALANSTRVPKLVFKNNLIRNKRNRGLLVQTRNVVIENNTFSHVLHGALLMIAEINDFHESIAPKNFVIKNNKFLDNNAIADGDITAVAYGKGLSIASAGVISDIVIENNFLAYSRNGGICLKGVSDTVVSHNLIYSPGISANKGDKDCAIMLQNCKDITIENNRVDANQSLNFKSVFINTGVDLAKVKLHGNIGINHEDIYGSIKAVDINKLTKNIVLNDNSIEDWAGIGNEIAINSATDKNLNEVFLDSVDKLNFDSKIKLAYDDNGVYLMYDVIDNDLNFLEEDSYFGDIVEIYFTTETKSYLETSVIKQTNENTLQIWALPSSVGGGLLAPERTSEEILSNKDKIVNNLWITSSGYQGEVFIPFNALNGVKELVESGKEISLTVNFFDVDSGKDTVYYSTTRHPVHTNMRTPAFMNKYCFI